MSFQPVANTLNPEEFVVAPHVAALDEFRMTNSDGSFAADITPKFLERFVAHMNERETATGDLCPLVIGHTMDGIPETEQPPVVGFARNWHLGELGSTGRKCAFFDAWIYTNQVELAKKYPRRSCEVWASRFEADPISLLGATTPARDLGLLKLSREGSIVYHSPGEMNVPEPMKPKTNDEKPAADPKETGAAKGTDGKLDQILSLLTELLSKMGSAGGPGAPAPTEAEAVQPGAAGAGNGGAEMDDAEYEALLKELMGEEADKDSRAGEDKTKNSGVTYPNGQAAGVVPNPAPAKMSRSEQELQQRVQDLEAEVTRGKVRDRLVKLSRPDIANPEDANLVEDLVAMPPDVRERQFDRISKTPAAPGAIQSTHLSRALDGAVSTNDLAGGKKRMTREDAVKLSRQASAEKKTFEQVASEHGFDLNG
jgi:hypothetical protein